jgi:predicted site-specific integrase-resolvase
MKAKEVLKILNISRQTLSKYVKDGNVLVSKLSNGDYDYDKESVFKLLNNNTDRSIIIIENISYPHDNKCVQTFIKNNIQEQIGILKIKDTDDLMDVLKRVQNYEIKKIAVIQDDYDTICFLRKYKLILEQTGCEMVLMINSFDS